MILRAALLSVVSLSLVGCGLVGGDPEPIEFDDLIRGVNYVGVSVSDINATETFYQKSIETENIQSETLPPESAFASLMETPSAIQTRLLRRTNAQLRVMSFSTVSDEIKTIPAVPVEGPGIAHVCFQVAKETNAYERILEAGADYLGGRELARLNPRNPVFYGYVKDQDGIVTEIEEVDVAELNLPTPAKNQFRVRHVSLATPDVVRLKNFYSAFLGGQEPRHVGKTIKVSGEAVDQVNGLTGSKIEMAWVQLRNLEIEMFQYHSHQVSLPDEPRPVEALGYNMIVFDVSNIEAAQKRLTESGGIIISSVSDLDGGEIVFGRDPDGNLIGLQTLPSDSVFSAQNFPDNGL